MELRRAVAAIALLYHSCVLGLRILGSQDEDSVVGGEQHHYNDANDVAHYDDYYSHGTGVSGSPVGVSDLKLDVGLGSKEVISDQTMRNDFENENDDASHTEDSSDERDLDLGLDLQQQQGQPLMITAPASPANSHHHEDDDLYCRESYFDDDATEEGASDIASSTTFDDEDDLGIKVFNPLATVLDRRNRLAPIQNGHCCAAPCAKELTGARDQLIFVPCGHRAISAKCYTKSVNEPLSQDMDPDDRLVGRHCPLCHSYIRGVKQLEAMTPKDFVSIPEQTRKEIPQHLIAAMGSPSNAAFFHGVKLPHCPVINRAKILDGIAEFLIGKIDIQNGNAIEVDETSSAAIEVPRSIAFTYPCQMKFSVEEVDTLLANWNLDRTIFWGMLNNNEVEFSASGEKKPHGFFKCMFGTKRETLQDMLTMDPNVKCFPFWF